MTLDEAIRHAEEVAEENENNCKTAKIDNIATRSWERCAEEHRQLAEWLKELKQLREQPKTGHWTKMVEIHDLWNNYRMLVPYGHADAKFGNTPVYVCDCGCESTKNSRFCPDCGAKMEEVENAD